MSTREFVADTLALLPPPPALLPPPPAAPDPLQLTAERVSDLCVVVRELADMVQQQGRDLQALKGRLADLAKACAIVQEGKSAFISRLTSAAHDWDEDMALSHEPEEEEQ